MRKTYTISLLLPKYTNRRSPGALNQGKGGNWISITSQNDLHFIRKRTIILTYFFKLVVLATAAPAETSNHKTDRKNIIICTQHKIIRDSSSAQGNQRSDSELDRKKYAVTVFGLILLATVHAPGFMSIIYLCSFKKTSSCKNKTVTDRIFPVITGDTIGYNNCD